MKTLVCVCALFAVAYGGKLLRALTADAEKAGTCPASSGMAGICVFDPDVNCLRDSDCTGDLKCCSEGCGKVCKPPAGSSATAMGTVHLGSCPAPQFSVGICLLDPNHCVDDSSCASNEKCCPEGCNKVCKKAVLTVGTVA